MNWLEPSLNNIHPVLSGLPKVSSRHTGTRANAWRTAAYRLPATNSRAGPGKIIWCTRRRPSWPSCRVLAGIRSGCAGEEVSTAEAFKAGRLIFLKKKVPSQEQNQSKTQSVVCPSVSFSPITTDRFPQVYTADDVLLPGAMTRFAGDPTRIYRCIQAGSGVHGTRQELERLKRRISVWS